MIIIMLLMMITMSTGVYIFNTADSSVYTEEIEVSEVQMFNDAFLIYEGEQIGSQVKTMISRVINNIEIYSDDNERLPDISYISGNGPSVDSSLIYIESDSSDTNIDLMSELKTKISNTHYYYVEIICNESTGLVEEIIINY